MTKVYNPHKLGKKEVSRLVNTWREQGLQHRTIANRMVDIRWLADKVNRSDHIPSNKDIGIGLRKNAENYGANKAEQLSTDSLSKLSEREQLITELRANFGLRTAEALKFSHTYATQKEGFIQLKGSWCKGGRPREIEITNDQQRDVLERTGEFQKGHKERSMIPGGQSFKAYYRDYNEAREIVAIAGHGLRHQWAQDRFREISGLEPPIANGKPYDDLSDRDRVLFDKASAIVNQELGHGVNRLDITATYIGSK